MSQVLLTTKDVQDNINNNNVADYFMIAGPEASQIKSRLERHDPRIFPSSPSSIRISGTGEGGNFEANRSSFWRPVPSSSRATTVVTPNDNQRGRVAKIEEGLDNSVGPQAKERINRILNDVNSLSDVEKLLLYLKLPTGSGSGEDAVKQLSNSALHTSNRVQQGQAYTWIKSHLEEDHEICLPKQEVFEEYRSYCENHSLKCLSTADFGKVMKGVFPNVKPRRLGQRGQSRYCYSGLRKKLEVQPPSLPELEISPAKNEDEEGQNDELFTASCHLVCEWAQKLLEKSFPDLRELAEYLVSNSYVNSKSMSAFTIIAAVQESRGQASKGNMSQLFSSPSGGNKHRETQLQLQRKLQERELMKEQKRRLQQQKSEIEKEQDQSGKGGNVSGQELSAPTTPTSGRLGTTPVENLASPAKSTSSCSPNLTPTRADSLESRSRLQSEMEFLSPVVIRDSYRRRNSQSGSEKNRRRKEKEKPVSHAHTPSDLETGTVNNANKLERNLFPSSTGDIFLEKSAEKGTLPSSSGWTGTSEWKVESNKEDEVCIERMDTQATVAQKYVSQWSQATNFKSEDLPVVSKAEEKNERRFSQVPLKVPIAPSRSAFVPFQQRMMSGSQGLGSPISGFQSIPISSSPSIPTSSVHASVVCAPKANLSKGLARLLLSKPTLELNKTLNIATAPSRDLITRLDGNDGSELDGSSRSTVSTADQKLEPLSQESPNCIEKPPAQKTDNMRAPSSSPSAESNLGMTSPLTPRRTKTRFTPIRPKAPAPRTVSSMLREQRGPGLNMEGVSFGNKPVAEILKEKRERETVLPPVSPVSRSITKVLSPACGSQTLIMSPAGGSTRRLLSPANGPTTTLVSPASGNIGTLVSPSSGGMGTLVSSACGGMGTLVSPVSGSMGTLMSPASSSMGTLVSQASGSMGTLMSPASSSMGTLMSPPSGSMGKFLSNVPLSPKIAIPAQIPIVNSGLHGQIDISNTASSSSKTSEVYIIVGASPSAGSVPDVSSVKPRRSNTISIPIVQKDIITQLNPRLQVEKEIVSVQQYSKTRNVSTSRKTSAHYHQHESSHNAESSNSRGNVGLSYLVHNVTEPLVDKMETEDSSVSAVDSSTTSKRKRKSPGSFKELPSGHTGNGTQPVSQTSIVDDDDSVIFIGYSAVKNESVAEENNPKRSKSCLPQLEHKGGDNKFEDKSSVCPDITSLESDALLDIPQSAAELVSSLGTESGTDPHQSQTAMKTASVGVTSRSVKLSQKLLRQSMQLDKRIDTFLKRSSQPKCSLACANVCSEKAVVVRSPADLDVMSNLYQEHSKHGKTRTASDTKLGSKRCPVPEKPVSTVHRGVVQTSNSFVVKKPHASKQASRDHFLLKLLRGDSSSSTQMPQGIQPSHELPAIGVQETKMVNVQQNQPMGEEKGHVLPCGSTFFDELDSVLGKSGSLLQDMDVGVDTELPSDVADFITEAMEKRSSSGYLSDNGTSLGSAPMGESGEEARMEGHLLSRYDDVFPSIPNQSSQDPSAEILSSQIPQSHPSPDSLFTVPTVPLTAQRDVRTRRHTPVQRSVSVPLCVVNRQVLHIQHQQLQQQQQQQQTRRTSLLMEMDEKLGNEQSLCVGSSTNISETSSQGYYSRPVLHRLNSNERHGSQTPISDAGYHSFDSSPVHNTTPLPVLAGQHVGMDSQFLHQSSEPQPSKYQMASQQSMSPYPSPRGDQTSSAQSTPMSIASPHQTMRNSAEPSPIEHLGSPTGFMPIAVSGTNSHTDTSSMDPIKPMVTLAASPYSITVQETKPSAQSPQSSFSRTGYNMDNNSNNIVSTREDNSSLKKLPSYQDAVLSLQRQTPTLPSECLTTSHQSEKQPHLELQVPSVSSANLEAMISHKSTQNNPKSLGKVFGTTISPEVFPFSYQLSAMLKRSKNLSIVQEGGSVIVQDPGDASRTSLSASDGATFEESVSPSIPSANEQVEFQSVATLIKHYHASSKCRQQTMELRGQGQSVTVSLGADLAVQVTNTGHASTGSGSSSGNSAKRGGHFDLPDARYMGSTPNVDIRHLLTTERQNSGEVVKQGVPVSQASSELGMTSQPERMTLLGTSGQHDKIALPSCGPVLDIRALLEGKMGSTDTRHQRGVHDDEDATFMARRNLSQMLGSDGFNESDLQTTLEDLKSLDTQYFNSIPFQAGFGGANTDDLSELNSMDLEGNSANNVENPTDSQST